MLSSSTQKGKEPQLCTGLRVASTQERIYILPPILIAIVLLFDQIIIFGLSAIFGRGGGVGTLFLIFIAIFFARQQINRLGLILFFLGFCAIAFQVNAAYFSELYVAFIAASILYISCSKARIKIPKTKIFEYSLWLILAFNILSKLGIDAFELASGIEANRPVGLYSEPSHLAFYVIIIYLFSIKTDSGGELRNAIPALLLLFLNFSLTAILPIIIIMLYALKNMNRSKRCWGILTGVVLLTSIAIFNLEYIEQRNVFLYSDERSLTVQVLFYYYAAFVYFAEHNFFFGFGPDRFYEAYLSFADAYFPIINNLNATDGSFLLVKLTGEFGLVTAIIFLYAVSRRLYSESIAVLLVFLQYTFLRGFGITSAIPISMLLLAVLIIRSHAQK